MTALLASRRLSRVLPVTLLAALATTTPAAPPARPNLVFVMSDQHSWDMLGAYGNRDIRTPNFDRLAREGVRFNHCISNSPVCTHYRGTLFSGQHPLHCGAIQNDIQILPGKGTYFAEVLRDGGYRTGYYGKWHLYGGDRVRGIPPGSYRYGFDHEFLSNNCTLLYDAAQAYYWDQDGITKKLYGDWEPYAQTRQAMEFIDRHADQPFALFLAWHPPHNPAEPNIPGGRQTFNVLYDCESDPWETRNLFADPAATKVREDLHARTLALMRRYGDPGIPFDQLLQRVVREDDYAAVTTPPPKRPKGWEGRLKGRPIDFLGTPAAR